MLVHTAETPAEAAVVIRALLESCGISSPDPDDPLNTYTFSGRQRHLDVGAPESQAAEARRILAGYAKDNASTSIESGDPEDPNS
ncbi:MAG: hypothetical protein WB869_09045 [Candidatus Acidiferrales bacterium]